MRITQRGDRGETSIIQLTPPVDTDPFLQNIGTIGPTAVGLPRDFNDPSEGTVGISAPQRFSTPFPNRVRSFSSRDYLQPVVDSGGNGLSGRKLRIQSRAFVSRVLFNGTQAIGVEYFNEGTPGKLIQTFADHVILAAGALSSPAILERSGIGDPAILEPLGIKVLVDNPNVGSHLQNHYSITARMTGGPQPVPSATGFTDLRGQGGYVADGIRRMQMNISTIAGNLNQFNGVIANPKSRGSVHIVSTNPTVLPQVDHGAYTDGPHTQFESDANIVVNYLRYVKQLADQNGRTMVAPPPADFASDDALFAFASATPGFLSHQVGTTRMAGSIADGVVDGRLHVFGVQKLLVADIGIEPLSPDGNTAYSAFVIGLEAARILGADIFSN